MIAQKIVKASPDATSAVAMARHLYRHTEENNWLRGLVYFTFADGSTMVVNGGDLYAYNSLEEAKSAFRPK